MATPAQRFRDLVGNGKFKEASDLDKLYKFSVDDITLALFIIALENNKHEGYLGFIRYLLKRNADLNNTNGCILHNFHISHDYKAIRTILTSEDININMSLEYNYDVLIHLIWNMYFDLARRSIDMLYNNRNDPKQHECLQKLCSKYRGIQYYVSEKISTKPIKPTHP